MKVRLTKALPQIGRVIPAGVILSDAPEALMEKLVRQGRAVWVLSEAEGAQQDAPPRPDPLPFTDNRPRRRRRQVADNE